ncbi:hypothetical protein QEN19_003865 [Hanseniaspora menglaensis]
MNSGFLSDRDSQGILHRAGSAATDKHVTVQDKLFGSGLSRYNKYNTNEVSKGVVGVSLLIVLTSALNFLLGVVIVIKYRTLPETFNKKMVANASVIVLCVMLIFYLHKLNLKLYKYVSKNSTGRYSRLVNMNFIENSENESFEMQEGSQKQT